MIDTTVFEVLEKVDRFYSASFSQLLTVTLGLVAFIGILIPFLVTYYQNRNLKIEKSNLEVFITNQIEKTKLEITKEIKNELINDLTKFAEKQSSDLQKVTAGVYYIQANNQLSTGDHKGAVNSLFGVIDNCMKSMDELILQRGLKILIECLPKINNNSLSKTELYMLEKKIGKAIKGISLLNDNGRYTDDITNLVKAKDNLTDLHSNNKI